MKTSFVCGYELVCASKQVTRELLHRAIEVFRIQSLKLHDMKLLSLSMKQENPKFGCRRKKAATGRICKTRNKNLGYEHLCFFSGCKYVKSLKKQMPDKIVHN